MNKTLGKSDSDPQEWTIEDTIGNFFTQVTETNPMSLLLVSNEVNDKDKKQRDILVPLIFY